MKDIYSFESLFEEHNFPQAKKLIVENEDKVVMVDMQGLTWGHLNATISIALRRLKCMGMWNLIVREDFKRIGKHGHIIMLSLDFKKMYKRS